VAGGTDQSWTAKNRDPARATRGQKNPLAPKQHEKRRKEKEKRTTRAPRKAGPATRRLHPTFTFTGGQRPMRHGVRDRVRHGSWARNLVREGEEREIGCERSFEFIDQRNWGRTRLPGPRGQFRAASRICPCAKTCAKALGGPPPLEGPK